MTASIIKMRERIKSAGVAIHYQGNRVVSSKPGTNSISWRPNMNKPENELDMLQRMAQVYHVPTA